VVIVGWLLSVWIAEFVIVLLPCLPEEAQLMHQI
jgi:hypothetical protein